MIHHIQHPNAKNSKKNIEAGFRTTARRHSQTMANRFSNSRRITRENYHCPTITTHQTDRLTSRIDHCIRIHHHHIHTHTHTQTLTPHHQNHHHQHHVRFRSALPIRPKTIPKATSPFPIEIQTSTGRLYFCAHYQHCPASDFPHQTATIHC